MRLPTERSAGSRRIATALLLPALGMGLLTGCGSDTTEQSCHRVQELEEKYDDFIDNAQEEMDAVPEENERAIISTLSDSSAKYFDYAKTADKIARNAENQELADGLNDLSAYITLQATSVEELAQLMRKYLDEDWDDERVAEELDKLGRETWPSPEESSEIEKGIELVNEICETDFPTRI